MEELLSNQEAQRPTHNLPTPNLNYSVQKLLRNTASFTRFKLFHSGYQNNQSCKYHPNQPLPAIVLKLHQQRENLQYFVKQNHSKLNQSFSHYHLSEVSVNREFMRRKKVTKAKKAEEKAEKMIELPKTQHQQGNYHQSNLKVTLMPNQCFDSIFPTIRYEPALFASEKEVYLLGGYREQGNGKITLFHHYDRSNSKWVQMKNSGEVPKISLTNHSVQIYKNHLIVLGGVSLDVEKGARFNNDLLVYNLEKGEWLKSRQGVAIKNHASTLFGSTLMISGGINDKLKFNEDIFFITFTSGNLLLPLLFTVRNNADIYDKLANHKIVHTYDMDTNIKNSIKLDGIFSFGGQNENGQLNNELMYINAVGKNTQNLDIKFKKWEIVLTNEDKPCPRKNHSFNILNKKGIALLAGGVDEFGNWLTDLWLFDFVHLHWRRLNNQPLIEKALGHLGGHCACSSGNSLYIYNGNVEKKRDRAFLMLEFDPNPFKSKKTLYSTKLPTFKTIHSEKQNNISLSQI